MVAQEKWQCLPHALQNSSGFSNSLQQQASESASRTRAAQVDAHIIVTERLCSSWQVALKKLAEALQIFNFNLWVGLESEKAARKQIRRCQKQSSTQTHQKRLSQKAPTMIPNLCVLVNVQLPQTARRILQLWSVASSKKSEKERAHFDGIRKQSSAHIADVVAADIQLRQLAIRVLLMRQSEQQMIKCMWKSRPTLRSSAKWRTPLSSMLLYANPDASAGNWCSANPKTRHSKSRRSSIERSVELPSSMRRTRVASLRLPCCCALRGEVSPGIKHKTQSANNKSKGKHIGHTKALEEV